MAIVAQGSGETLFARGHRHQMTWTTASIGAPQMAAEAWRRQPAAVVAAVPAPVVVVAAGAAVVAAGVVGVRFPLC